MRVDRDKGTINNKAGYIDLSKKKVHKQEELDTLDKFAKAKTVNSIMRTLSESLKVDIEQMFKKIAWPLYKKTPQPLQILIQAVDDETVLDDLNLDEPTKTKLMSEIRRRFQPAKVKIMSTFEVSVNDFEGVNFIKEALLTG
jgi:translation initiation factor 2 subunit 1